MCEVELVNGIVGQSYMLAFHYSPHAIRGALRDLAAFAAGRDATATQAFIRDWNRETEYFGQEGLQRWALGLANVAMWDAHARTLDAPVWRLLGGEARATPVYGSGGWLSYSDDELVDEVRGYASAASRRSRSKWARAMQDAISSDCAWCARPWGRTCA